MEEFDSSYVVPWSRSVVQDLPRSGTINIYCMRGVRWMNASFGPIVRGITGTLLVATRSANPAAGLR